MTADKKTISDVFTSFITDITKVLDEQASVAKAASSTSKPTIRTKVIDGRRLIDAIDLLEYIDHPRSNSQSLRRTLESAVVK